MTDVPYWNPWHETMPREARGSSSASSEASWSGPMPRSMALETTPGFRRHPGLDQLPGRSPAHPFPDPGGLDGGRLENPPYGTMVAAPQEKAIRYHMTSGTTGRTPIRVLDSMKDWEWIAEMWC